MDSKVSRFFVIFALFCLIHSALGKPRDFGVQHIKDDDLIRVKLEKDETKLNFIPTFNSENTEDDIIEKVENKQCEFEEATEHESCTEICVSKGYTYGLCVSFKCSCV